MHLTKYKTVGQTGILAQQKLQRCIFQCPTPDQIPLQIMKHLHHHLITNIKLIIAGEHGFYEETSMSFQKAEATRTFLFLPIYH